MKLIVILDYHSADDHSAEVNVYLLELAFISVQTVCLNENR